MSTHAPCQRYREAFRPLPTGLQNETRLLQRYPGPGLVNKDTPTHRPAPPLPSSRDTHKHLCRERGSHLRNECTTLSPQLGSRMHQTHVMARVLVQAAPNTPNSVPLRCFCLLPIRYGEKRQETRESRVYCGRDTSPPTHPSAHRITTSCPSVTQAGAVDTVPSPSSKLAHSCPSP